MMRFWLRLSKYQKSWYEPVWGYYCGDKLEPVREAAEK
jgi:hypothetical protein